MRALRFTTTLACVASTLAALSPLGAQSSAPASRPTFGVSGGLSLPTGDFGKSYSSGFDIAAHLGFHPAASPVGLRIEGMFDRFSAKGTNPFDVHTNILAATGNAVFGSGSATEGSIRPYFIAGLGIYNLRFSSSSAGLPSESSTKFGINGGAGLDLPLSGIAAFAEVRYHYVFSSEGTGGYNAGFVPIVVGVRF